VSSVLKKVFPIRPLSYKVIVSCPRCTTRKLIHLKDHPGYTLEDIHLKMKCSGCGAVGLDFSIVQEDAGSGN